MSGLRAAFVAILSLGACVSSTTDSPTTEAHSFAGQGIDWTGLESLFIDLRIQDARLLGYEFETDATDGECTEWTVVQDNPNGTVTLITFHGLIKRISVTGDIGVRTREGITMGSSSADVMAAYPGAESESAEYFEQPEREIFVWRDRENWRGLHFVIGEQDRVTEIQAGGELRNIEGCAPSP